MKKILLFTIITIFSVFIYTKKNKISSSKLLSFEYDRDQFLPYINYKRFILSDYEELEALRIKNNYNYLETINYFYLKNLSSSPLIDTNLVLINKQFFIDKNYKPTLYYAKDYTLKLTNNNIQLKHEVIINLKNMLLDLNLDTIYLFSGYRSYTRQEELYFHSNSNYIAKAGHSEHQTGLAIDISNLYYGLTTQFFESKEYKVLIQNCHKYGFILRYPQNKEHITLYNYEPWHYRYVGKDIATYIYENDLTYEEYIFRFYEI